MPSDIQQLIEFKLNIYLSARLIFPQLLGVEEISWTPLEPVELAVHTTWYLLYLVVVGRKLDQGLGRGAAFFRPRNRYSLRPTVRLRPLPRAPRLPGWSPAAPAFTLSELA